jgi:hypothetical protein
LGSGLLLLIYNCDRKIDLGFAAKILQEADKEMTAIKFVVDGLGVALTPEQITGLSHEGTLFLPPLPAPPPRSANAWRADNPFKPLQDYIQIVKRLYLFKSTAISPLMNQSFESITICATIGI